MASIISLNNRFSQSDTQIDAYIALLQADPATLKYYQRQQIEGFNIEGGNNLFYGTQKVVRKTELQQLLTNLWNTDPNVVGKGSNLLYKYIADRYINVPRTAVQTFLNNQSNYQ